MILLKPMAIETKRREQSPPPQTLGDARIAVRNLPGAENYIPTDALSAEEIDRGADVLIQETLDQLDAENMLAVISYDLGWSDQEAATFFSHPDRKPFQSRLDLPIDSTERVGTYLTLGNYLRLRYRASQGKLDDSTDPNEDMRAEAARDKQTFRQFYEDALESLFGQATYNFQDRASGIDPADRRAGTIQPSEDLLATFRLQAERIAAEHGMDASELYEKALGVTEGGNTALAGTFLINNTGGGELRQTLQAVIEQRAERREIATKKMQLLWQAHTFGLAMGMDWETLLEVNDLPSSGVVNDRLLAFLTNPAFVQEMEGYLDQEAHDVYGNWKPSTPINYWDVLSARAEYHSFSGSVETTEELEAKRDEVYGRLRTILPLGFEDTPTNHMFTPTRLGATVRPSNITYYNKAHGVVNVVILNPRDEKTLFEETTGHEAAHKMQAFMLTLGERVGYLPQGINEKVPGTVKEEFSQLVEGQVGALHAESERPDELDEETQEQQREFRDLFDGIVGRRQAPYGLIQQEVRLQMERMQQAGVAGRDLSDEVAQDLIDRVQPQVEAWYQAGLPLYSPAQKVHNNAEVVSPLDGLVYVTPYIVESQAQEHQDESDTEVQAPQQSLRMRDAFEQRFGRKWLNNQEARVVLLSLMAESGRNQDITSYGDYVLAADVKGLVERLQSWGIGLELV